MTRKPVSHTDPDYDDQDYGDDGDDGDDLDHVDVDVLIMTRVKMSQILKIAVALLLIKAPLFVS